MQSIPIATYDVQTEDVVYLRHGDKDFPARIYKPSGDGPFPAVIEAHGGAWCMGSYTNNDAINRAVASGGIVVAALEFRNPPDATYPGSVADINYGIRWLKANAQDFGSKPEWVGAMGTSSGGHLAVLAAMKPDDERYKAFPLAEGEDIDARAAYVVTLWPVICPLGRYQVYQGRLAAEPGNERFAGVLANQDKYWLSQDAMAEGSPNLALQRGDAVELPDMLYLQNPADGMHPAENLESFTAGYRKAGGTVTVEYFEGPQYDHMRAEPDTPSSRQAYQTLIDFVHSQCGNPL